MGYKDIKFDESIPKGYKIAYTITTAGTNYRIDNCLAFVNGLNHQIELQAEPGNEHDKNAIMVVGNVTLTSFFFFKSQKRILLGYIPADIASILAPNDTYKNYKIRQRYAGASEKGAKIEFQLLEKKTPKTKKEKQNHNKEEM